MFIVYRVFSPYTNYAFYAYASGNNKSDVLNNFLRGANNPHGERADHEFFELSKRIIDAEILKGFNQEINALNYRNQLRSTCIDTFTGPTCWPMSTTDNIKKYKRKIQLSRVKTARQAWSLGLWTKQIIKDLCWNYSEVDVMNDLDHLSPDEFSTKYVI